MMSWEIPPSVFVYTLSVEMTTMAWARGLRQLIIPGPLQDVHFISGMPFDHGRNTAMMRFLESGADYAFSLDSDVIPPRDAILRLISRGKPVISGVYARRSPPVGIPVMIRNGQWVTEYPAKSLIEVDVVGAGCLLIHRSVIEKLPPVDPELGRAWFSWRVDRAHLLPPGDGMSEDFVFCKQVREKLGIPIVVDTSVVTKHVGLAEALPGHFGPIDAVPIPV